MNLMIDTNIFLDVLMKREPFFQDSKSVLVLCEQKKIQGFISATTVTDIYYLIRKHLHSKELAYKNLGYVLDIAKVLTVTNEDVVNAYAQKASDFEDCLLAVCARSNHCDGIVTRNAKDFESFDIMIYSPQEILLLLKRD